jgi:hypothetical protein
MLTSVQDALALLELSWHCNCGSDGNEGGDDCDELHGEVIEILACEGVGRRSIGLGREVVG